MNDSAAQVPHCYRHPARETWIRCQRCDRPICPDCMVGAAVGFQCPDCVKQGAKQTRSGRAAYGGARSTNPLLTSLVLIAVNAAVFLLMLGSRAAERAMPLLPAGKCEVADASGRYYPDIDTLSLCASVGGDWVRGVADGALWQVLTSAFAHVDPTHLLFNLLAIYFLGPMLEAALGRTRFLAVYLVSALSASALVMALSDPEAQTLGASGAVFGLMGALLVVGWKVGADLRTIGFWLLLNLAFTFVASSAISWQGHLGGLAGGAVTAALIVFAPKQGRAAFQWTAVAVLVGLLLVAIAVRAAAL